jgi:hypothetical protein
MREFDDEGNQDCSFGFNSENKKPAGQGGHGGSFRFSKRDLFRA